MRPPRRIVTAAAVALLVSGCGGPPAGPLDVPPEHGWIDEVDAGEVYVSTGEQLHPGDLANLEGVTVTEIDAAFLDEEVEVLWTGIATSRPGGGVAGSLSSWPPGEEERRRYGYDEFREVDDSNAVTVDDPAQRVEIVVVYQAPSDPGRYLRDDVVVRYRVAESRYELVLPARGLLCVDLEAPCSWTDADDARVG